MAFDSDLTPLLRACSGDDLDPLVTCVLSSRTNRLEQDGAFKAHRPDHTRYVEPLIREIRLFGGNTLRNQLRGEGVAYATIVHDVARRLRVKHGPGESVEQIERTLLIFVLEDAIRRMKPADRAALAEEFRSEGLRNLDLSSGAPLGVLLAQAGISLSGPLAYRMAMLVANHVARVLLGRGLSVGAGAALAKMIGLAAGPVGWAVTGAWAAIDLSGPAYRVTVPIVLHVALLRQKLALQLEAAARAAQANGGGSG
jgi:uncharacterized protein YaaW (UPF0174 family)